MSIRFMKHGVKNVSFNLFHVLSHTGKAAEVWSWPLTSIYCPVQECVELYLHSPNSPSWRGDQLKKSTGSTLPFTFISRSDSSMLCVSRPFRITKRNCTAEVQHYPLKTYGGNTRTAPRINIAHTWRWVRKNKISLLRTGF